MPTIIVFSHLRWDFVFQRPQHLLSRLATAFPVLYVEEPLLTATPDAPPFLAQSTPLPGVTVCVPHTPIPMPGFHDDQLPYLRELLQPLLAACPDPIVWLYTPMALPLLQMTHPRCIVYDCMDELAAFRNAPKQLLQRESAVLRQADLVFTGGPSLYRAKRDRHPRVHCFPSSVDVAHFARALLPGQPDTLQQAIAHPRAGYYGVIDERLDLDLIASLADARPALQIVLVGPVVKIDVAQLPRRPNIHCIGQQPYAALPEILAGWDLCLLPFALNEATRYISPTKTLEFMAAERPIVGTRIADVADLYQDVVRIADDAAQFIAACDAALAEDAQARSRRIERMRDIVGSTSWDRTASEMKALLTAALEKAPGQSGTTASAQSLPGPPSRMPAVPSATVSSGPGTAAGSTATTAGATSTGGSGATALRDASRKSGARAVGCLVIGAGPTGLSAVYHSGTDCLLLEKNAQVGGWCRSVQDRGFTFDYAGHIMFSNDAYVQGLYRLLLGDNLHWQDREAWVYSKGVNTRYPFQGALHGLPPKVISECIIGAIEARFGSIDRSHPVASVTPSPTVASGVGAPPDDCCADGCVALPSAGVRPVETAAAPNFEQFIHRIWGAGIARHFAIPYNRKLWTVPLSDMETSWLGGRVPLPDLKEIIEGALEPVAKPMGPNARFGYPLRGGFQALMNGFLPHVEDRLELQAEVVQVAAAQRLVTLADGRRFRYDHLISTMPLPVLIGMIGEDAPLDVRLAARGLQHISVRCVNLGIGRENLTDKHWIYYPEDTVFHRIFVQGNASPACNPPGGFGLTCEISYSPLKPLPCDGQQLIDRCLQECIQVGLVRTDDVLLTANQVDLPYAYVVYDHARAANVATVKAWLAKHDIVLAGRYSEWEYYNSDHAFIAGKKAAETVRWLQAQCSAAVD